MPMYNNIYSIEKMSVPQLYVVYIVIYCVTPLCLGASDSRNFAKDSAKKECTYPYMRGYLAAFSFLNPLLSVLD